MFLKAFIIRLLNSKFEDQSYGKKVTTLFYFTLNILKNETSSIMAYTRIPFLSSLIDKTRKQLSTSKFFHKSYNMSQECQPKVLNKVLIAFDFDHTIIDQNSDIYVTKLAPDGKIPSEIKALYSDQGWTKFMGAIFGYLHKNNTTPDQILACMREISFSPGIPELLSQLDREKTESIIISDANSVFIEHILESSGLHDKFDRVFTNPARFSEQGKLEIDMYHVQDTCSLSTVNLCKGHILEEYVEERAKSNIKFSHIAFVGDGVNDFCPSLRLSSHDFVFPREGHSLISYIKKMEEEKGLKIKANVVPWLSGIDIYNTLLEKIPFLENS